MRILREEDGQTLVMTALCATVLIGFMGLAVDVGVLFHAKRNLQTAADDAAIAGRLCRIPVQDFDHHVAAGALDPRRTRARQLDPCLPGPLLRAR